MNDARSRSERADSSGLRRGLLVAERGLVLCGALCLVVFAVSCAERSFFQSWQGRSFDRELEQLLAAEQHDQTEWSPQRVSRFEALRPVDGTRDVAAIGRLEIPQAAVSVMVLEGTDDDTLDRAVGRIEGTARPGEGGNMGIAGHRDSFFRGLRNLVAGDAMTLATRDGLARYEVAEISIVEPRDVEVLDPTDDAAITLVTCYPFYFVGNAPQRYIVRAYQVGFDAWSPERLERYAKRGSEVASRD